MQLAHALHQKLWPRRRLIGEMSDKIVPELRRKSSFPPAASTDEKLSRTITEAAHDVITHRIRKDLTDARRDAFHYQELAKETSSDLDDALKALDAQRIQFKVYGAAAAGCAALLGGLVGAMVMRQQLRPSLVRCAQEVAELRAALQRRQPGP